MDVKWIFFDVGSTLMDETGAYNHRVRQMIAGTDITFSAFDSKRIELAKQGFDGNTEALVGRGYHLGIIANQVPGTAQRLDAWGLLKYFDVVAASAEMGAAKPDPLIFEKALELAGCQPCDSVMVGDRLDNDIRPAKELGMRTGWIRKGLSKHQPVDLGKNVADWIINNLPDLKAIFE